MTGRAIRRIGREWPGHTLTVAGMAGGAAKSGPMVTRIVATRMHIIPCRQPSRGAVTTVALLGGDKVPARHSGGSATVVTAVTGTDDIAMIHPQDGNPGGIAVAVLTYIRTLDMPCMLAGRSGAVVTAGAVGANGAVIEIGRHPGGGGMTEITGVVAGHMARMLTGRSGAVVTTEAGAYHLVVIHSDRRYPSGIAMTGLTHIRGLDMAGVLTRGRTAVMTGGAVRRDGGMVEVRRCPGRRRMAEIAGVITRDMGGVFTGGRDPVMTAEAGADDSGMVHSYHRCPSGITVTILTHICGLNM